ncbi:hypothetical protein AUC61_12410 [Pseudomonas sp. S25]|uniref:DUF4350 domain-containing protein n=1 Tax=Pseudomonas maioricensis TaxID=1766623 RepID=A0ABS9ZIT6_9PSED|nr:DUF4350 domain-containing protein [Pseudomonas sp. S25]MCI8210342.1 hypothetical protein [Pseudomonas sp. S25]
MTRRNGVLLTLIVLVLCLGAVYLLKNLEHYEETVDQGPSPEARGNPWLAAESFLRNRSIAVKIADSTNKLPDTSQESQTLLLLDSREHMTPAQADQVLHWARSGGHLLFVARQLWDEKKGRSGDLLLDRLHIHQLLTKDLKGQEYSLVNPVIPLRAPAPKAPRLPWPDLTRLYLENEEAPAYIGFDPRFHLEDPEDQAQSWANSAGATHMLQLIYGDGLITVVTDAELWKTRSIGRYDNAWLLWYLTQDSKVTMVVRTQHDNLFNLLLRHFPLLLLMLLLLVGAGLWRAGMRQGPLRAPAAGARRQLTEHLRASAEFLRRRSGPQSLLRALQTEILHRARIRHPGFDSLMVADQWQVLARLTRQPGSVISQAMRPRPAQRMSSSDFTRQVAHLQTIRNAL